MSRDAWLEEVVYPLTLALDDATDMPESATLEARWAKVMETCPWLKVVALATGSTEARSSEEGWTTLKSTNLEAFRGTSSGELEVKFKNGSIYRYDNVSPADINGLQDAESPGGYFSTWIKDRYAATKIADKTP